MGAAGDSAFDGRLSLLESEIKSTISLGYGGCTFTTKDENVDYISNMGNIMLPYPVAIGKKVYSFFMIICKLSETKKIEEGLLVSSKTTFLIFRNTIYEKVGKKC